MRLHAEWLVPWARIELAVGHPVRDHIILPDLHKTPGSLAAIQYRELHENSLVVFGLRRFSLVVKLKVCARELWWWDCRGLAAKLGGGSL